MVLDELVLENFGVYAGRQSMTLTPPSKDKPIILIGGLNGGGKTTILNALRLVLYGKRAGVHGRQRYGEYLRQMIHRGSDPENGAAIELSFRYRSEAQEHSYRVIRSWKAAGDDDAKELLEVWRNEMRDDVLSDGWPQLVEEFIPSRIAPLFFFDGEKIEALADPEESAQVLSEAIHSLLGIDMVKQLHTDLLVLERRKRKSLASKEDQEKIRLLESQIRELTDRRSQLKQSLARVHNEHGRSEKKLEEIEERFRDEGGQLLEQRENLEKQRSTLEKQIAQISDHLRDYAANDAPLNLVTNLLDETAQQSIEETEAAQAERVQSILTERDQRILTQVTDAGFSKKALKGLRKLLEDDRRVFADQAQAERHLHLPEQAHHALQGAAASLQQTNQRLAQILSEAEARQSELDQIDRKLEGAPDEEIVQSLVDQRTQLRTFLRELEANQAVQQEEINRLSNRIEETEASLTRLLESQVHDKSQDRETRLYLDHAQKVRTTLGDFTHSLLERHLGRLESAILESFQQLLAKKKLIKSLRIDPKTFKIELRDSENRPLPAERLSAGERQLLAVSLLWGLARSSGRNLPTVVDTPLGRLDSVHRANLLKHYYPRVSFQVCLLVTDSEISAGTVSGLAPRLARRLHLYHLESHNATYIREPANDKCLLAESITLPSES